MNGPTGSAPAADASSRGASAAQASAGGAAPASTAPGGPPSSGAAPDGPPSSAALTDDELAFLGSVLDLARAGRTEELAGLLDAGIPVNLTSPAGDSLLMLAAYHAHPETVTALLHRGADTERVNDRGQTALAAAVFRRHAGIVTALLAAGADPHGGTTTPVATAEMFELDDMRRLLAPGS